MTVTLGLREESWNELAEALKDPLETAGFLFAGIADDNDAVSLLGRAIRWIPADGYSERSQTHLVIPSRSFVPLLRAAQRDASTAVFVHTHPGGSPTPSSRDEVVDEQLSGPARMITGQSWYASLVVGGSADAPTFAGRIYNNNGESWPIDRLRVVGRRLRIISAADQPGDDEDLESFDRHVRAFGEDGQRHLRRLRVGVVGVGGTGSAVAEQLARLGVGHLTLIDDKEVTDKNITRIHESRSSDIGRAKVDVLGEALTAIGLGTEIRSVNGRILDQPVVSALRNLDVVFGCTDDQRGRAILSRLAYWYLVPVIDMGFMIDSEDGSIEGLFGRVTTLIPGAACLMCREHITPEGIRLEGLPPEERQQLVAEGYAPELGDPDPSVGTFTTMTAMFAVNTMLERLIGYSKPSDVGASTEISIRLHSLTIGRTSRVPVPGHFCGDVENWGRGDTERFLGRAW